MRTEIGGLRPSPTKLIAWHEYSPAWASVSTLNVNVFEAINVPPATSCANRLSCKTLESHLVTALGEKFDPSYLVIPNDGGRWRVAVHVAHQFQVVALPQRVQNVAGCQIDRHHRPV